MNEVPLFWLSESKSVGSNLTRNHSNSLDAKVPLIDRKQTLSQSPNVFQIFILRALALMIQNSSIQQPQEQSQQQLYVLQRNEIELLVNEVSNRSWWRISILDIPMARNAVSTFWSTFCKNETQQSQIYLKQIFCQINENNFQVIKKVERLILDFCRIQDQYQNERINRVLNYLNDFLKKNTQFWKTADSLIELTIKLCKRCKPFAIELTRHQNIQRMIEQFTKENSTFPIAPQGQNRLFKDFSINWGALPPTHKHLVTEQRVNQISNYSKSRLQKFHEILKAQVNNSLDSITPDDSDDDCYSIELKEGDIVDAKYSKQNINGWYQTQVIVALDEMVRVKLYKTNQPELEASQSALQWIDKESQKLAKRGTQTSSDKSMNHNYFCELMRMFETEQGNNPQTPTSQSNQSGSNSTNDTSGNTSRSQAA